MRSSPKIGQNNLINGCLVIFEKSLHFGFKKAAHETLARLFDLAENAESNQQEVTFFEQYNTLKKNYSKLFNTLSVIIKNMPDEITDQISHDEEELKLSLVEDEVLEISLALTQLESALDVKFSKHLFALEKRLKVLFSSRKITKENMPFGVTSISWIFSQALDISTSDVNTKVILIENLKQQLGTCLAKTYEEIDQIFVNAGILPNIKIEHKTKSNKAESSTQDSKVEQSLESGERRPQDKGVNREFKPDVNTEGQTGLSDEFSSSKQLSSEINRDESGNLVNSIFDLMNSGRNQATHNKQLSNIDNKIMDQTLNNLSKVTSVAAGSTEIDKLKEMILEDVRNETGMFYPGLNQTQQNSLDVMGMFYEHVKDDNSIDSNIVSSLNAINIPILRTAIRDKKFFQEEEHPARVYLEKLIYAAQKWHGTPVVKKLHQFSSHLASDYDGSNESFELANNDLENYLNITEKRAKKSEEKWVNSVKGKEKLDYSRSKVEGIVNDISAIARPDFVKNIIKYVIQDALTLSLLRNGEGSDDWNKNIQMSHAIAKMANPKEVKSLTPKQKIESLHHLDQTMDDLGFSENDRKSTLQNVKDCAAAASIDKLNDDIKLTNVASINKNKEKIKHSHNTKIEEIRKLSAKEKTFLSKIKLMPYGTLFDFIMNQQRDKIRRKLSWFSPVSNKALFVSLLGNQPYEISLNAIAIDMARNNILVVKAEEKKYFNKVLGNIFTKLKKVISE